MGVENLPRSGANVQVGSRKNVKDISFQRTRRTRKVAQMAKIGQLCTQFMFGRMNFRRHFWGFLQGRRKDRLIIKISVLPFLPILKKIFYWHKVCNKSFGTEKLPPFTQILHFNSNHVKGQQVDHFFTRWNI